MPYYLQLLLGVQPVRKDFCFHSVFMNCSHVLHFILEKNMFYTLNNVKLTQRNKNQTIFGPTLKKV